MRNESAVPGTFLRAKKKSAVENWLILYYNVLSAKDAVTHYIQQTSTPLRALFRSLNDSRQALDLTPRQLDPDV